MGTVSFDGPPTPLTRLPCGCRFGVVDDTFILEACAAGEACPSVQYVLRESAKLGHEQTIVDGRGDA